MELQPNKLLDEIKKRHEIRTDTELAKFLFSSPAAISDFRRGRKHLSPLLLLKIHDRAGMSIDEIRKLSREQ